MIADAVAAAAPSGRSAAAAAELRKLPAFVRRDFLVAWSYKAAFFSEFGAMFLQTLTFYFLGGLIKPSALPTYGGNRVTYMEFVVIGMALTLFIGVALGQVALAIRNEQLLGTLESILVTPTAPTTVQVGSVAYALLYIPLRIATFVGVVVAAFGLRFEWNGLGIAVLLLVAFVPFVWGLGLTSASAILTFKRGAFGTGLVTALLTLASGAYFPLSLLPGWVRDAAAVNPLALATGGMRDALLGGAGLGEVAPKLLVLVAASAISVLVGIGAFRLALARERRRGTLGLY